MTSTSTSPKFALSKIEKTAESPAAPSAKKLAIIGASTISLLLLTNIFGIFMLHYLSTFTFVLAASAYVFLGVLFVISIVKILKDRKFVYSISLLAALAGLLILFFQPLHDVSAAIDYKLYKADREKIAAMLMDGTMKFDPSEKYMQLPDEYAHLSKYDGNILVQKESDVLKVCFFTTRGLWKAYPAFVFIQGNEALNALDMGNHLFTHIQRKDAHWYWANITNGR